MINENNIRITFNHNRSLEGEWEETDKVQYFRKQSE